VLPQLLARNWEYVRAALPGPEARRIGDRASDEPPWRVLAPYADNSVLLRYELLDVLEKTVPAATYGELLEFLARTRPRSKILADYCIATIRGTTTDDAVLTAIALLEEHFPEDADVKDRLLSQGAPANVAISAPLAVALSQIAPEAELLQRFFAVSREVGFRGLNYSEYFALTLTLCDTAKVGELIERAVLNARSPDDLDLRSMSVGPLVRRIRRDDALAALLQERLRDARLSSEVASIARLLSIAQGISQNVRELLAGCLRSLKDREPPVNWGEDLVASEMRSVELALLDALDGER
jgi:hypothetical protein